MDIEKLVSWLGFNGVVQKRICNCKLPPKKQLGLQLRSHKHIQIHYIKKWSKLATPKNYGFSKGSPTNPDHITSKLLVKNSESFESCNQSPITTFLPNHKEPNLEKKNEK